MLVTSAEPHGTVTGLQTDPATVGGRHRHPATPVQAAADRYHCCMAGTHQYVQLPAQVGPLPPLVVVVVATQLV